MKHRSKKYARADISKGPHAAPSNTGGGSAAASLATSKKRTVQLSVLLRKIHDGNIHHEQGWGPVRGNEMW